MNKKIFIIDGNSLLFRAYYATAYGDSSSIMRTRDGIPTNAIFAFSNMISKILSSFKGGESIFIGFDSDKETFRHAEFASYKANRKPAPEDLVPQFAISRELCKTLGIIYYEEHGIEADDICGTLAKRAAKKGYEVTVYTSDHDYLQLIEDSIKISLLKTGLSNMEVLDTAGLKEKYGLTPSQVIDFKGLRGDTSDNYPGIPGIGDKTALKLLGQYSSFQGVIDHVDEIPGKLGEKIKEGMQSGKDSYRLATIKTDVNLPFDVEDCLYQGYDFSSVNDFAKKYEFKQLLSRLPIILKKGYSDKKDDIAPKKVQSLPESILKEEAFGIALDMDYDEYHEKEPLGIAFATSEEVFYLSIEDLLKDKNAISILSDEKKKKDIYDGKAAIYALNLLGITLKGIRNDLLLEGYLLDSSLKADPISIFAAFGVDIEKGEEESAILDLGCPIKTSAMAFYASSLQEKAKNNLLSVNAFKLYSEIEMPLMAVLAKMEIEGFPIHKDVLDAFGKTFTAKKKDIEKKIYEIAGSSFNINSPKQIAEVLYEQMGLKGPKSKSTSVEALSEIKDESPIVPLILEYRKYAKLLGTYVEGLVPHIKSDNKIHSYFNQAETTTGRLSSSSPNLQNISARDEEGKQIRKAFYFDEPDTILLSLDYSQIELRILAALSNCKAYIDVFNSGRDVHTETARKIFHEEEITPLERRRAKAVNFAIIYGTTVYGLSEQIGGTPFEAQNIIKAFYRSYPEVGTFLNSVIHDAETKGYVETMFGRRRYLRDVNDPNYAKREAARRAALNAPVQGSAADLIKIAMVKIDKFLSESSFKAIMVLQIHDELIFKVPKEELDELMPKLKQIMTECVTLPVKLTVEEGIGKTWFDAKE